METSGRAAAKPDEAKRPNATMPNVSGFIFKTFVKSVLALLDQAPAAVVFGAPSAAATAQKRDAIIFPRLRPTRRRAGVDASVYDLNDLVSS
jgi:hypothetical protein